MQNIISKVLAFIRPPSIERVLKTFTAMIDELDAAADVEHAKVCAAEGRIRDLREEIDTEGSKISAAIDQMHRAAVLRTRIADLDGA